MLPEWPDLLVMETYNLSLLTSPWRFFVAVYSTMVSAYLVERPLCPGILFLQSDPVWPPTPWLQKYVVLHQV